MKNYIFWGFICFLIFSGTSNMLNVFESGKPLSIPFLDHTHNLSSVLSIGKNKVAPVEEWKNILKGKWVYKITIKDQESKSVLDGEVKYHDDGTFTKHLTYKVYVTYSNGNYSGEPLYISGGKIEGTWIVNKDNSWTEKINNCNIKLGFDKYNSNEDFSLCENRYRDSITFAKDKAGINKIDLQYFNNSKILIKEKNYISDKIDKYLFNKVKN